jgi:hypothetical protein
VLHTKAVHLGGRRWYAPFRGARFRASKMERRERMRMRSDGGDPECGHGEDSDTLIMIREEGEQEAADG